MIPLGKDKDDIFVSRREERQPRRHEYRRPKANSCLILTEQGTPQAQYFKGFAEEVRKKAGGNIQVAEVALGEPGTPGRSIAALLARADELVSRARILYQQVWLVLDREGFDDFDEAVWEGEKKGYRVAWNNPSFAYWLYLHFYSEEAPLGREDWNQKLAEVYESRQIAEGTYDPASPQLYFLATGQGSIDRAIKHARERMVQFTPRNSTSSQFDPGTTSFVLAEQLLEYLTETE